MAHRIEQVITSAADAASLRSGGLLVPHCEGDRCKICGAEAKLFGVVDFNRSCQPSNYPGGLTGVPIYYRRCTACHLVYTCAFDKFDSAAWRRFIYNNAYFEFLDPDYEITRPRLNSELVGIACRVVGRDSTLGIDYGGGNGALSKILNKQGIRFFTYDPYAESNVRPADIGAFNLLSSFEVLEHTTDPISTFQDMLRFVGPKFVAIISTQCSEKLIDEQKRLLWNYVAPRNGHVCIYSRKSLVLLAERFSMDYLSISRGTHLFGRNVPLITLKTAVVAVKILQRLRRRILSA